MVLKDLVVPEVTAASLLGVTLPLWRDASLEVASLGVDTTSLLAIRLVSESPTAASSGLATHSITTDDNALWLVVAAGHAVGALLEWSTVVSGWAVLDIGRAVLLLVNSALRCWRVIGVGKVWVEVLAECSSLGVLSLLWLWVRLVPESPRAAALLASHSVTSNVNALLLYLTVVKRLLAAAHSVSSNDDTLLLDLALVEWLLAGSHAVASDSDALLKVVALSNLCRRLVLEIKVSLCVFTWTIDVWSADWRLWYLVVLGSPMADILAGLRTGGKSLGWHGLSRGVEVVKAPAWAALVVLFDVLVLLCGVSLAGVGARGDIEVLEFLWIWLVDLISAIGCDWGVLVVIEEAVDLEVLACTGLWCNSSICGVLVWGIRVNLWLGIRIVSDEQVMVIALGWLCGCTGRDDGREGLLVVAGIAWSKKGQGSMWIASNIRGVFAGSANLFLTRLLRRSWSSATSGSLSSSVDAVDDQLDLILSVANWPVAAGLADNIDELEEGALVPAESDLRDLAIVEGDYVDLRSQMVSLKLN